MQTWKKQSTVQKKRKQKELFKTLRTTDFSVCTCAHVFWTTVLLYVFILKAAHKVVASGQYLTWLQTELQRRKSASNQIYSARAEHTEEHTEVQKYFGNFYCTWHCIFYYKPRVFFFPLSFKTSLLSLLFLLFWSFWKPDFLNSNQD